MVPFLNRVRRYKLGRSVRDSHFEVLIIENNRMQMLILPPNTLKLRLNQVIHEDSIMLVHTAFLRLNNSIINLVDDACRPDVIKALVVILPRLHKGLHPAG